MFYHTKKQLPYIVEAGTCTIVPASCTCYHPLTPASDYRVPQIQTCPPCHPIVSVPLGV